MKEFLLPLVFGIGLGAGVLLGGYGIFRVGLRLEPEEALRRAVALGVKFWQIYSFRAAAPIGSKAATGSQLYEAGLVLKSLIVSELQDPGIAPELKKAHPELLAVDPMALAERVAQRVQGAV
ncbi:hypothetical protein [Synechococcus sp. PCC 6312]|uniref:hypothetical protein n=1 Tax=Synechococcus sp. (strain ATCC 27167 / PCC 6312) TaxID=195253 RepID=UPI00029F3BEF|nr:hypothetical protein [Synechococcus sp. PCC 6312]AFY60340.1 hypothetical protein Syn6312_1151 [Synechococcus sp. PCC 6312]